MPVPGVGPLLLAVTIIQAGADTNDPLVHYDQGMALVRAARLDDARAAFQRAVAIDPQLADGWVMLVRLHPLEYRSTLISRGGWRGRRILVHAPPASSLDSITHMARRAFLLNPLLEIRQHQRYPMPQRWKGTLTRGRDALRAERYEEAAAWFDTVIRRTTKPGKPEAVDRYALWYHARARMHLGQWNAVIDDLQRLLDRSLRDSSIAGAMETFTLQYTLAYVRQQAGHWDEAARLYRQLLEDNLGLDLGHTHLAEVLEAQGRLDDAVLERHYARNANPDDPSLQFDLGVTLLKVGRDREAEQELRLALEANPREVRAHYTIGLALAAQGRAAEARESLLRFLDLAPPRYTGMIAEAQARLAVLTEGK
jgi:tetratricopeptide (TPR) repeat protein